MTAEIWLFLGTVIAALLGFIGSYLNLRTSRRETYAKARKLEDEITESILQNAKEELDLRDKRIDGMEDRILELEQTIEIKNKYVNYLEEQNKALLQDKDVYLKELDLLKTYVKQLLDQLRRDGVKFREPPEGLLDTQPKVKAVKK